MALTSSSTFASSAIPSSYGCVLFTVALICLHYALHAIPPSKARNKYFTKQFFKENFPGVHTAKGGYPDMGSGRYADKLDTQSWIDFNNAQRVHYNYLESIPIVITCTLISGLSYPRYTVLMAWIFMIGRTLYTMGYLTGGAQKRGPGAIIGSGVVPLLMFGALGSSYTLSGGVHGFVKLLWP